MPASARDEITVMGAECLMALDYPDFDALCRLETACDGDRHFTNPGQVWRNTAIRNARRGGQAVAAIAAEHGITHQRVYDVLGGEGR